MEVVRSTLPERLAPDGGRRVSAVWTGHRPHWRATRSPRSSR